MDSRDYAAITGGNKAPMLNLEFLDKCYCPNCKKIHDISDHDFNDTGRCLVSDMEYEIELPWKWEVCDLCNGKGTHVNPSIDSNGLTAEDFAEDPDFQEDYFGGVYDQQCNECHGRSTVMVPNEEAMTEEIKALWHQQCENTAAEYSERAAEMRWGY